MVGGGPCLRPWGRVGGPRGACVGVRVAVGRRAFRGVGAAALSCGGGFAAGKVFNTMTAAQGGRARLTAASSKDCLL